MHQKSNRCTKSNSHVHVRGQIWYCRIAFVQCSSFETVFGKTLTFVIKKYANILLYFMKGCLYCFYPNFRRYIYVHVHASRINNDILGREICTLCSLMRVSRILQLFSPFSLNVTILHRIHGEILGSLSMPFISVTVFVYFTTKSTMTEIATV
jgi:hypothetical protein